MTAQTMGPDQFSHYICGVCSILSLPSYKFHLLLYFTPHSFFDPEGGWHA